MAEYQVATIGDDITRILEGFNIPFIVQREIVKLVIENRIDEIRDTFAHQNRHDALMVMRTDASGREVSRNERLAQLDKLIQDMNNIKP